MIHFCSCTGGSASNLGISRKRAATTSCKTCGGKPLVDGKGLPSGSMLDNVTLELTSFIDSDLTWKVSKGNRSSSRRARKSISRGLKAFGELLNKDPKTVDMPVSESEKLGVSVLGCRFSEKAELVPIKKRKFLCRSPSPPPKAPSPHLQDTEKTDRLFKSLPMAIDSTASPNDLGQIVDTKRDVNEKNSARITDKLVENEDFSGISILAAAACSNSFGGDDDHAEEGSGVEESCAPEAPVEVSINHGSHCMSRRVSKEDLSSAEISTEGTVSCISAVPVEEFPASLKLDNSQKNVIHHGNNMENTSVQDHSVAVSKDLVTNKDEGTVVAESKDLITNKDEEMVAVSEDLATNRDEGTVGVNELPLQDDRLYWDLNTSMDAWKRPYDYQCTSSQTNVAHSVSRDEEDGNFVNKFGGLDGNEVQRLHGRSKCDVESKMPPTDSSEMVHGEQHLNLGEHKSDVCADNNMTSCLQESLPSESGCTSKVDHLEERKSVHTREHISSTSDTGRLVPSNNILGPSACIKVEEGASSQCVDFGYLESSAKSSSHQVARLDSCTDSDLSLRVCHSMSLSLFDGNSDAVSTGVTSMKIENGTLSPKACDSMTMSLFDRNSDAVPTGVTSMKSQDANLSLKVCHPMTMSLFDNNFDAVQTGVPTIKSEESNLSLNVCHSMSIPLLSRNLDAGSTGVTCVKSEDGCAAGTDEFISSSSQVGKPEVAPPVSLSGNTACVTQDLLHEDAGDAKEIFDSHGDSKSTKDMVGSGIAAPLDDVTKKSFCQHDEVGLPPPCSIGQEVPASNAVAGGQHVLAMDLNIHGHGSVQATTETGTSVNEDEEPTEKFPEKTTALLHSPSAPSASGACRSNSDDHVNISDKVPLGESFENGYDSDVSLDDHDSLRGSGVEVDYDSQYEDGEVRESIVHTWEEYDGEDVETEHVDYGSDNANDLGFEGEQILKNTEEANSPPSHSGLSMTKAIEVVPGQDSASKVKNASEGLVNVDNVENKSEAHIGKVSEDSEISPVENNVKKASQSTDSKMKMSGQDRLHSSDSVTGVRDVSGTNNISGDGLDGLDVEDASTRIEGSRTFRRDLRSRIEGIPYHDISFRKDKGSSDANVLNPRSEREFGYVESFGRGRYTRHTHARRRGDDYLIDSSDSHRGLKWHHSPNYQERLVFRPPGPDNGVISHSIRRRIIRSGSPDDRDVVYGMRMDVRAARELSPCRGVTLGRGRSVRYGPRADGRDPRGRYHRVAPDDPESSLNHSHPPVKRDRSFSPFERRGDPHVHRACTKSPERSRTRSPNPGNPSFRRQNKSPNFRSEVRMQRMRSPPQRSGFLGDHVVGFRSMRRNHGSSPHNSRWVGDRTDGVVNFREQGYNQRSSLLDRRSPGRFGLRDDRFELVDSPRNYKSMHHPGRFSEMDGVGRGRIRYEGSDDDRGRHGYKYGLVHAVKRFRYNVDDDLVTARNSHYRDAADFHGRGSPKDYGRGLDGRIGEVPRKFREERGPFMYRREGKYNVNSKSFGMREGDDDTTPRRPFDCTQCSFFCSP